MNVLEVRNVFPRQCLAEWVGFTTRKKLMPCLVVVFAVNCWPDSHNFLRRMRASLTEAREEYGAFMVAKSVTIASRAP
jgi:hypothetical protein